MTKDELKKEAEEWVNKKLKKAKIKDSDLLENQKSIQSTKDMNFITFNSSAVISAYLAGAEPREKHIAELKKDCEEYSKTFNRQNDEIISLRKERIEAKKIIRDLLEHNLKMHNYVMYNLDEEIIKQAEVFLSGSGTDK